MPDQGEHRSEVVRLPVDKVNAGPNSEAWVLFEKHAVALEVLRDLVAGVDLQAVVPQHSSDALFIYRDARPTLVSIKHREPHQASGDSGWDRPRLAPMLTTLHRQWSESGRACRPVFWSNAGFVKTARTDHRRIIDRAGAAPDFVQWLITELRIDQDEAIAFADDPEFTAEPLPRKFEIEATGAAATSQLLASRGRSFAPLYARECFAALTSRIIALSLPRPQPPSPDTRHPWVAERFPMLDSGDAAAVASRLLPAEEAEAIVLTEHDRRLAATVPTLGFGWEPDTRFVGREPELAQLEHWLDPGGVGPVAPVVIRGMAGCGKSSLAMQFAATHDQNLRPMFISGASRVEVVAALHGLDPDQSTTGIAQAHSPVAATLPGTSGLLLVLDGVTDADTIAGLIPSRSLCRVVITTTVSNLDSRFRELELGQWSREESMAFLHPQLPHESAAERDRLSQRLYDHPLALNQAADHCRVRGRSIEDYLRRLGEAPAAILELGRAHGHRVSIVQSIRMNIEAVHESDPDTLILLTLLSVLGPSPVREAVFDSDFPLALLHAPTTNEPVARRWSRRRRATAREPSTPTAPTQYAGVLRKKLRDKAFRDRAVDQLARMSLVNAASEFVSVHPLIALVARDRIEDLTAWLEVAVGVFLPLATDTGTEPEGSGLDDHLSAAAHATVAAFTNGFTGPAPIAMALRLCQKLMVIGPHEAAAPQDWNAIKLGQHASELAQHHAQVMYAEPIWKLVAAQTRFPLAQAYSLAGRVDEALKAINEAMLYGFDLGDYRVIAEAVVVAEPIVTIHGRRDTAEVLLGYLDQFTDRPFPPSIRVQLLLAHANVLRLLARTDSAADMCDRALDIIDTAATEVSPLLSMRALTTASLLARDRGDALDALRHARALMSLQQRPESAAHIAPLSRILNLHTAADAAVTASDLDTAAQLLAQARELAAENGFDDTPLTAADHATVSARLAAAQGQHDAARTDFETAISILESLGEGFRPRLPAVLVGLGDALHAQGHTRQAIARVEQALAIDEQIYPPDHPELWHERVRLQIWTASGTDEPDAPAP